MDCPQAAKKYNNIALSHIIARLKGLFKMENIKQLLELCCVATELSECWCNLAFSAAVYVAKGASFYMRSSEQARSLTCWLTHSAVKQSLCVLWNMCFPLQALCCVKLDFVLSFAWNQRGQLGSPVSGREGWAHASTTIPLDPVSSNEH